MISYMKRFDSANIVNSTGIGTYNQGKRRGIDSGLPVGHNRPGLTVGLTGKLWIWLTGKLWIRLTGKLWIWLPGSLWIWLTGKLWIWLPGAADPYFAPLDNSGKLAGCQEGQNAPLGQ